MRLVRNRRKGVLLIPGEGTVQLCKDILGAAALETWQLHLYQNNHTPAESDTTSNYTESTFTGYSSQLLTRDTSAGHWATPVSQAPTGAWSGATNVAESTYASQSWSPTSSQTVYGYYVTGNTSTKLIFAELFASAKNLSNGDTLSLTPRFGVSRSY
jgi:hypothetical protein